MYVIHWLSTYRPLGRINMGNTENTHTHFKIDKSSGGTTTSFWCQKCTIYDIDSIWRKLQYAPALFAFWFLISLDLKSLIESSLVKDATKYRWKTMEFRWKWVKFFRCKHFSKINKMLKMSNSLLKFSIWKLRESWECMKQTQNVRNVFDGKISKSIPSIGRMREIVYYKLLTFCILIFIYLFI